MTNGGERHNDDPFTTAIDKAIGTRLRRRREALGLTQEQAGRAVGMSTQTWKTHEDGVRIPASRLWKFCVQFGVDVHDIFAGLPTELSDAAPAAAHPGPTGWGVAEEESAFSGAEAQAFAAVLDRLTDVERRIALAAIKGIAGPLPKGGNPSD